MKSIMAVGIVVAAMGLVAAESRGEDAYYSVPLAKLQVTEGKLGDQPIDQWLYGRMVVAYATLDDPGEAYLFSRTGSDRSDPASIPQGSSLLVRSTKAGEVTGRLYIPFDPRQQDNTDPTKPVGPKIRVVRFKVAEPNAGAKADFLLAKQQHYQRLLDSDAAGAAWFRHQVRVLADERQVNPADAPRSQPWRNPRFTGRLDDAYSLFTGGRAISENLQLDREFQAPRNAPAAPGTPDPQELVDTDKIAGITIAPFDFAAKVKDKQIALDPIASIIPADQHALFLPTFNALINALDQVNNHGSLVLGLAEPRSEDQGTFTRYEKQLCLPLSELARKLGPAFAKSVAVTGSDPYMASGTDVAIVFESAAPALVQAFIAGKQIIATSSETGVKNVSGNVEGLAYRGVVNGDRSICSYVATVGENVVVTNSLAQLRRLAEVHAHKSTALAEADDYRFFRDRYKKGDAQETALLMISDATIRRWCGPRWRLGDARRVRAAAVMAELQAQQMDRLVTGKVGPGRIDTDLWFPGGAEVNVTPTGVISATYNTPAFLTPIAELSLEKVSRAEAQLYERWRDGYARNWSGSFDPIAVRFTLQNDRLATDLSVIPLILGTQYNDFATMSGGAAIAPDAGDRHKDARAHFIMAFNRDSPPAREMGRFALGIAPQLKVDPLGWMGQSISIYADEDPFWDELAKSSQFGRFAEANWRRLPVAIHFEVSNALKLAVFLGAVRGYIEQSSPGLTVWETLQHNDIAYVKVSPSPEAVADDRKLSGGAVYYAATGRSLVITFSEPLLKRALDRVAARRKAAADNNPAPIDAAPWLGQSLGMQIDQKVLTTGFTTFRDDYQAMMQLRSWSNLPILNEWKRLHPGNDPVQVHQRIWGTLLICPGGGGYVWNEKYQTMESTVYGHPGEPKLGPATPPGLAQFASANFGVTFEDNGLRARVELLRPVPVPQDDQPLKP